MRVRRLGWAGLEVEAQGETVVVDLLQDVSPLAQWIGPARAPLLAPEAAGRVRAAMVTHLHSDHTDAGAIAGALAPDGVLLRPAPATGESLEVAATAGTERALVKHGVPSQVVEPWETVRTGPFALSAVPAVDGFGDPQIGWVVAAGEARIVAYGDTLFHGSWWLTRMRLGPFGAAFLPVNGPIVNLPHRQPPSPLPAAMTPEQAAAAATLLAAQIAVPVHYDTLHNAPVYVQVDDPAGAFAAAAGTRARVLEPGEWIEVPVERPDPVQVATRPSSRNTSSA